MIMDTEIDIMKTAAIHKQKRKKGDTNDSTSQQYQKYNRRDYDKNYNQNYGNNYNSFKQSNNQNYQMYQTNQQVDINPPVIIDYSFILNTSTKLIKEYIINKIKSNQLKEEDFILPRETLYQLIIIIDKLI